jgi:hypothetical protein
MAGKASEAVQMARRLKEYRSRPARQLYRAKTRIFSQVFRAREAADTEKTPILP